MSENQQHIPTPFEGVALPSPTTADLEGFREQVKIWHRPAGTDTTEESIFVQMRETYKDPLQWAEPLARLATTVAGHYGTGQIEEKDIALFAAALLVRAASLIVAVSDIRQLLPPQHDDAQPPGEEDEGEIQMLPIPDEVMETEGALHLYSIWRLPEVEDCADCADDHAERYLISGRTTGMKDEAIGDLLGRMAHIHCLHSRTARKSDAAYHKAVGEIQKGFLGFLNQDLAHA